MDGIDVGQAEVTNQPLAFEILEMEQRLQPARVGVVPGVKLQEVQGLRAQARQRAFHGLSRV